MAENTPATRGKFDMNKPAATPQDLQRFLEGNLDHIRKVANGVMDPIRMVKIVTSAASRNPTLAKCTPLSILRCLVQGAELGLEVAGQLQEFHPVPYWNASIGAFEAQGIPGFQGLLKLVKASGEVSHVDAAIVYRGDVFDYERGLNPRLVHKPCLEALEDEQTDENILAFYAIGFFKDGSHQFEVMGKAAVDKIRTRAQSKKKNKNEGPWYTDYAEMGLKTVIRRLCKRLPKSSALAQALDLQGSAETETFNGYVVDSIATDTISTEAQEVETNAWPLEALEAFEELMEEAYKAFCDQNLKEHWPVFEQAWRPKRNRMDDKGVLRDLKAEVASLQPTKAK